MPETEGYIPPEALETDIVSEEASEATPVPSTLAGEQIKPLPDGDSELGTQSQSEMESTSSPDNAPIKNTVTSKTESGISASPRPEDDPQYAQDQMEAREEIERLATRGLAHLYELLPRVGPIDKDLVSELLEITPLNVLTPVPRRDLVKLIVQDQLHLQPKPKFIIEGLLPLQVWIGMEALKDAGDAWLDRQQKTREQILK